MTPSQLYNIATYDIELSRVLRERALKTLWSISMDEAAGEHQLAAIRARAEPEPAETGESNA